jgi:hypothetical protein
MASKPITMEPAEVRDRLQHLLSDVEERVIERCKAQSDAERLKLRAENASLRRTNRVLHWIIRIGSVLSAAAMLWMVCR